MISRVKGKVRGVEVEPGHSEVEVCGAGVGYAVRVTAATAEELKGREDEVELFTHLSVSEAGWTLYGFLLPEEKAMFRRLLKVSRLGPGLAMKILEGAEELQPRMDTDGHRAKHIAWLEERIAAGDAAGLEELKGVGEKLAKMIVVQLGENPKKKKPATDPPRRMADG